MGFKIGEATVQYDVKKQVLSCGGISCPLQAGKTISLDVLVDRGSIEVFGEQGRVALSKGVLVPAGEAVRLFNRGEPTAVRYSAVELKSIWK